MGITGQNIPQTNFLLSPILGATTSGNQGQTMMHI